MKSMGKFFGIITLAVIMAFLFSACEDGSVTTNTPGDNTAGDMPGNTTLPDIGRYLGLGYDVINSSFINRGDVKIGHQILDHSKMFSDGLIISDRISNIQRSEITAGQSIAEFYASRNVSIQTSMSASYRGIFFSGNSSLEFGLSANQDERRIDENRYVRGRFFRYTQEDYIMNATADALKDYLTDGFVNTLRNRTAVQIINQYGSHVLIRYYKGGAMEFNFGYHGQELISNQQLSAALNASMSARIPAVGGATWSTGTAIGTTANKEELENNSTFNLFAIGGNSFHSLNPEQIDRDFGPWLNSITDNADIAGIVNNFDAAFIPVWEFAEAISETQKAQELVAEFNRRAEDQIANLITTRPATPQAVSATRNDIEISRASGADITRLQGDASVDTRANKTTYWQIRVSFSLVDNNRNIAADFEYEVREGGGDSTRIRAIQRMIIPVNRNISSIITPSPFFYEGQVTGIQHDWITVTIPSNLNPPISNVRVRVDGNPHDSTQSFGFRCNLRVDYRE